MKIGDLFIALGFQVKGKQEFNDARSGLKHAAIDATKVAVAVNAANVALLALLATGTRVAVGLKNFALQTGLSRDELQQWQHQAEVNDTTADELRATIVALQDERAAFALGEPKAVGAWALLGVDPRQDPFVVLDQLRERIKGVQDVGVARNLLARVGVSANALQLLRGSNDEFSKWRKQFEVTKQQEDRLVRLNRAWKDLRFNLTAIATQFAAALAPALSVLAKGLAWVTKKVAEFNAWLNSSAIVGRVFRFLLGALAITFLVVGAAAAIAAAALGAVSALVALLSPALIALLPIIAEVGLFLAVLTGFVIALVLAVDDMIASFTGGKSVLRDIGEGIGEWLAEFQAVRAVVEVIDALFTKIRNGFARFGPSKLFENFFRQFADDETTFRIANEGNRGDAWFAPKTRGGGAGGTWTQENNIEIKVDGAEHPETTGRAIGRSVRQEINAAAYQLPVPNN